MEPSSQDDDLTVQERRAKPQAFFWMGSEGKDVPEQRIDIPTRLRKYLKNDGWKDGSFPIKIVPSLGSTFGSFRGCISNLGGGFKDLFISTPKPWGRNDLI